MKNILFRGAVAAVALAAVACVVPAGHAQAASNVYPFTVRGIITDFDEAGKTIKVDVSKAEPKRADADLNGDNVEFVISPNIKVVKNANGKDKPVTYHNLAIGQEVAFKGFKKDDDTYVISFIRISDRSFTIIGNLESFDSNAKTMTILVVTSTYNPTKYVKKNVKVDMVFGDDYTTFYTISGHKAVAVSPDDVNADAQKVKVTGYVSGSNTWKATKFWDNYKASK